MSIKWPDTDVLSYYEKKIRLDLLFEALLWTSPLLNENLGETEPPEEYQIAGMLAYADGSNWDPGSGEGYYYFNSGGTWTKL